MPRVSQSDSQKRAEQNADAWLVGILEAYKAGNPLKAESAEDRGKASAHIIRITRRMANRFAGSSKAGTFEDVFSS